VLNRRRIASAESAESEDAEGFSIGFAEGGDDGIVHRDVGPWGWFGGVKTEQGGLVLGDGQGEFEVAGRERLGPEDSATVELSA
jgi:hypothetical protein